MEIIQSAKESIKNFLLQRQFVLGRATDFGALAEFFRMVRPIDTEHRLIRVGGAADGGYLIPDDLAGIRTCFSPGVSTMADFELDLAARGIRSFMADHSVDGPPSDHELFRFEKKFLGQTDDATYTTLQSWVSRSAPEEGEFILQMDIEGAEYGVIIDTDGGTLRKFRILAIEFHGLNALWNQRGFPMLDLAFRKLLKYFDVVHIHPNNYCTPVRYGDYLIPDVLEFTFHRKDRITRREPCRSFPHPLDRANATDRADYPLPACWYPEP